MDGGRGYLGSFSMLWGVTTKKGRQLFGGRKVHPHTKSWLRLWNGELLGLEPVSFVTRNRVASSEIFRRKFIILFLEISGNLLIFSLDTFKYNHMFPSPALQSDAVKQARSWQTILQIFKTLTLCIMLRKNNSSLAWFPEISAIPMKIIDVITSRLLLIFL